MLEAIDPQHPQKPGFSTRGSREKQVKNKKKKNKEAAESKNSVFLWWWPQKKTKDEQRGSVPVAELRALLPSPGAARAASATGIGCAQGAGWRPKWLTNELSWKSRLMWSPAIPRMLPRRGWCGAGSQALLGTAAPGRAVPARWGASAAPPHPHPSPPEYKGAAPAIQRHICIPLTSLHATTGIQSAPLFSREVCEAQFGFYSLCHLLRGHLGARISHVQKMLGWIYCLRVTRRKKWPGSKRSSDWGWSSFSRACAHGRTIKENTTNMVTQSYTWKISPENRAAQVRLTKEYCYSAGRETGFWALNNNITIVFYNNSTAFPVPSWLAESHLCPLPTGSWCWGTRGPKSPDQLLIPKVATVSPPTSTTLSGTNKWAYPTSFLCGSNLGRADV